MIDETQMLQNFHPIKEAEIPNSKLAVNTNILEINLAEIYRENLS